MISIVSINQIITFVDFNIRHRKALSECCIRHFDIHLQYQTCYGKAFAITKKRNDSSIPGRFSSTSTAPAV